MHKEGMTLHNSNNNIIVFMVPGAARHILVTIYRTLHQARSYDTDICKHAVDSLTEDSSSMCYDS